MSVLDMQKIEEELVVLLRNSNVLSTSVRGVTTITQTFNGNASDKTFSFSQSSVKNVRSVTVDTVLLTRYIDYTVNYFNSSITFTNAPATGTNNISIEYDYGSDKIFGEIPRMDLSLDSYPRIAVQLTSTRTEEGATDGSINYSDFLFTIYIYADNSNNIKTYSKNIRETMLVNKKNIYHLRYITPVAESSIRNADGRHQKIDYKTIELLAPLNEEIN